MKFLSIIFFFFEKNYVQTITNRAELLSVGI